MRNISGKRLSVHVPNLGQPEGYVRVTRLEYVSELVRYDIVKGFYITLASPETFKTFLGPKPLHSITLFLTLDQISDPEYVANTASYRRLTIHGPGWRPRMPSVYRWRLMLHFLLPPGTKPKLTSDAREYLMR